jgi:hypothetical protein
MKSDLVDIECYIMAEREKAIAIWDGVSMEDGLPDRKTGEIKPRKKWAWIPRSQIEITPNGKTFTVTMPEWLATEKGLI